MTDFITHEGTEPPLLAPAAIVEAYYRNGWWLGTGRIDGWQWGNIKCRVITDGEGHKLISADGLEEWARWVATDDRVGAFQYSHQPLKGDDQDWHVQYLTSVTEAPSTHRHPGDWRDSMYRVEGRP